jgi:PAS domain S-box-containing protein
MTRDNEDGLLRSVALQNAESIRSVRLRAEQKAEAALREQANLLDLTHDAIYVRDMNGTVKYWNRGAEELYGWAAEQAVGSATHELLKTIFQAPLEQIEEEVIGEGRWEGELVQTRKDGSQVVVASRWSLQRDESSAPVAILIINNDISERKRAEEAARRSEKELRAVVNAIPAFVWSTLPEGAIDFVNERWLEFTGLSPQDALGWNWEAVIHPNDRSRAAAEWREVLKKGRSTEGELRVRRADGEFRWWFFRNVPLRDETGNIAKWYGTAVDIDDRKRAEEKLLASEQRLLDAQMELARVTRVTTLGELTATIAHEVNQPLAGLVANAEACLQWLDRDTPDLAAVRRSVEWVIEDGNRASEVISRVRALVNKTSFEKVPLDVNEVVREAIALVRRELKNHQVSLQNELASTLPTILGDRVQLQQVIINLLMNGTEAMQPVTDRPRELVIRSRHDETQQVLVSVTDCGVGISAENGDRLFNAFFTTKSSGMGMGLSICRSIMEAHGGRLWATANVPHGTTFQFTLPVNADTAS